MRNSVSMPPSIEEVREAVRAICEKHSVARMEVFGSLAQGVAHLGSDVDLLVEFLPGSNVGLLEMGGLKEDLEERLGCKVDLLSRRAVERSRNPIRRQAILANSVAIYDR